MCERSYPLRSHTFLNPTSYMKPIIYIFAGSLFLSSCGLFGKYERNIQEMERMAQHLVRDTANTNAALVLNDTVSFGNTPWQEVFTDAKLQSLIRKALEQNTDIQKAALTVKQAEIGLRINKLAYLPQISLTPNGTISKAFIDGANTLSTYQLPVAASWQLDAFGTLYNAKKQGELSVLQAKAAQQATHTAIITTVANMYYSLQMLDEQISITHSTLELWRKNILAMEAMKEAGMMNSASISSAKAQVLQIEATVPTIEENIRKVENALSVLLHDIPQTIDRNPFTAEGFPTEFSLGVPLSLLANRPDLAIAEAKLANSFYGVQAARGAFFPKITITGQGAFTNSLGSIIMNPGKFMATGIASLTQPLFAQGKIKGNYEIAKLQQEAAQLDFQQALLTAGQEVSDALSQYNTACETTNIIAKQVEQLQKANDDTQFLFHNGNTVTYLETLTAQMSLLNGRLALVNQRYSKIQAVIALYKSLGGGRSNLS